MTEQIYPAGTLVKVTAEVRIPVAATDAQITEALRFEMTQSGGCSSDNPLLGGGVDAWEFDAEPTDYVGRKEEFDVVKHENGDRTYKVRRIREIAPA